MIIIAILMGLMFYLIVKMLIDFTKDNDSIDDKIKKTNKTVELIMNKPLKISFERFKSLYTMNPEAWNIESELIVIYNYGVEETQWSPMRNCYTTYSATKRQDFEFGYFDSFKYKKWRKEQLAMYPEELVAAFQKDIDNYKEKMAKAFEKQVEQIEKYMDEHPSEDEQWKENLKNVLLRICNRIEERKKTQ